MKSLLFLACLAAMFSCEKKNTPVQMAYHMTQCADPWQNDDFKINKEAGLTKFLNDKGIEVISLSITTDCGTAFTCAACDCLGCDSATVEVAKDDVDAMKALKFVEK